MAERCWIGMDMGGTNLRIGAVGQDRRVLAFHKLRTTQALRGPDAGARLVQVIRDFMQAHCQTLTAEGVSIAFPGTLNRARTQLLQVPNIEGLDGLKASDLEKALGLPVRLQRDVCTAMAYDLEKYEIPRQGISLGIYIGTGIGNVICIDGNELVGKNGAAGELGHIPVLGDETPCGCGNRGCAENLAGGKYLAKLCGEVFSPLSVGEIFSQKGTHPLVLRYIDHLAGVIAAEINIFDPDYVIIGGGVPAMRDFPAKRLLEQIRCHTRKPYPAQGLQIVLAEDEEQKGVIGAVLQAKPPAAGPAPSPKEMWK